MMAYEIRYCYCCYFITFDIGIVIFIQALQVFLFFVIFSQLLTNAGYAMDTSF